jgi:hypothetical protein
LNERIEINGRIIVSIVKRKDGNMKICIPTETNEGKSAAVYGHFGSAPYFTIIDTEKRLKKLFKTIFNFNFYE